MADRQRWRRLRLAIDLALTAGLVFMGWLTLREAFESADKKAVVREVSVEAKRLHGALERYFDSHRGYPSTCDESRLELKSLEPLRSRGYYRGQILTRLYEQRLDAYDSPDDRGPDQEYWLEMTLAVDPSIRLLVAKSDDAPMSGGKWCDGVFLYRDGALIQL